MICNFVFSADLYQPTGEVLGNGAYASVKTYKQLSSDKEFAVKVNNEIFLIFVSLVIL